MSGEDLTMTAEQLGLEPEIEIEIDDGGTTLEKGREIPPEEGIEELRAKLLAEQKAREQAEQRADQVTTAAQHVVSEKEQSDIALVQSALQQVEQATKELKAAYSAALKAGDTDKCAELTMDMQEIAGNRRQLEGGLEALKERAAAMRANPPQPPQRRERDAVEEVASRLTPASAKWVREHPEFATDDEKRNEMVAAHYSAVAKKITPDTPAYFEFIESRLGVDGAPVVTERPRPAPQRQMQPPAAPARGAGQANNKRVVTLSAMEREMAKSSGLTDEEYARNKMALISEGKIGKAN